MRTQSREHATAMGGEVLMYRNILAITVPDLGEPGKADHVPQRIEQMLADLVRARDMHAHGTTLEFIEFLADGQGGVGFQSVPRWSWRVPAP